MSTDDFFDEKVMDLLDQLGNLAPKQDGKVVADRIDDEMMAQIQVLVAKISDAIKEYDRQNNSD